MGDVFGGRAKSLKWPDQSGTPIVQTFSWSIVAVIPRNNLLGFRSAQQVAKNKACSNFVLFRSLIITAVWLMRISSVHVA
jgi:hypothetical protein